MRLAWYAGISAGLAASVVVSAFHQRANFYSAMVYLSQSNLCLLILVNLVFLIYASFVYGLQRLCFGQLRPVEIEQLYEKAWFAITETCLAMTIFREEIGGFFLVMFTALVTGKVWSWIGEGRIEVLEQQPPANPRLFHTRLSVSLLGSVIYDLWMLRYSLGTVIDLARPNMMVMFLFEFAILTVSSVHAGLRYILSLTEARIVKVQTRDRLAARRQQVRDERAEILRRQEAERTPESDRAPLPNEDDIDEMDIEVPGWESKGQYVLWLDLISDVFKLIIYTVFFVILMRVYGLPIHIIRDLFMTTRSVVKRLQAIIKYRQAVQDMQRYPDATNEELQQENTCIICREEMQPWDPNSPNQVERARPKRLPCGHILHLGCLKSWLERQQVCPTCRRSVISEDSRRAGANRNPMVLRVGLDVGRGQAPPPANPPADGNRHQQQQHQQHQQQQQQQGAEPQQPRNGVRMFNLGPLRFGIARGQDEMQQIARRMGIPHEPMAPGHGPQNAAPQEQQPAVNAHAMPLAGDLHEQLNEIDRRVQYEVQSLHSLLHDLDRIRSTIVSQSVGGSLAANQLLHGQQPPQIFEPPSSNFSNPDPPVSHFVGSLTNPAIPAGSPELPEGLSLPEGWSLVPLEPIERTASHSSAPTQSSAAQAGGSRGLAPAAAGTATPTNPLGSQNLGPQSVPISQPQETTQRPTEGHTLAQTSENVSATSVQQAGGDVPAAIAAPTSLAPDTTGASSALSGQDYIVSSQSSDYDQSPFSMSEQGCMTEEHRTRSESHDETKVEAGDGPATHGDENDTTGSEGKGKARAVTVEEARDEGTD